MAKKKSKLPSMILLTAVILAVIAAGFAGYSYMMKDINGSDEEGTSYTLNLSASDYQYQVAEKLMNNDIIVSDTVWCYWMDKHYPDFVYINGEYHFTSNMSYEEIAQKLQNPDVSHKSVSVCIPEGYNVFRIAETMEENGICSASDFLAACESADGYDYEWLDVPDNDLIAYELEGFLFPATYDLGENTDAPDVVSVMLEAFDDRVSSEMYTFCEEHDMTFYEFITLASIVQEEALNQESQGNIASVLMNRLEQGIRLQCDVTYYYAAKLRDEYGFSQEVYEAYYTYRCDGLPAGPIANSGLEILKSVVNYPETDYLFFFSDLEGEFHFAATGEEFEKLKEQYLWK